jgi:ATP-dependent DNA ligase
MRCVLFLENGRVRLWSRGLNEVTRRFPELSVISEQIRLDQTILDGELIIPYDGKSDFYKLLY